MDVILFENVPNLGTQGSVVSVAEGYFRNYLNAKGLAVEATEENKRRLRHKVERLERLAQAEQEEAQTVADKLDEVTMTFKMKAGEGDKLFGSVTSSMIAEELEKQGFEIDRHDISIPTAIKRVGEYTVDVKLHHNVVAQPKVVVEKEGAEAEKKAAEEAEKKASEAAEKKETVEPAAETEGQSAES